MDRYILSSYILQGIKAIEEKGVRVEILDNTSNLMINVDKINWKFKVILIKEYTYFYNKKILQKKLGWV